MLPDLGHVRQRIVGILAVEEGRSPVQVFEAERIVDYFLDDNAWHTIVIAGCQQGFQHGIELTGSDNHRVTLRTLFPRRMGAVTAVGKQVEALHVLWGKIVAQERYIIVAPAYFKHFLRPVKDVS